MRSLRNSATLMAFFVGVLATSNCHNYNILVTICGCWQRANEVYSYLLPATVGNWYMVQLFSWMIKLSFRLLTLITMPHLAYTKTIFKQKKTRDADSSRNDKINNLAKFSHPLIILHGQKYFCAIFASDLHGFPLVRYGNH